MFEFVDSIDFMSVGGIFCELIVVVVGEGAIRGVPPPATKTRSELV